jgi:hypothetical protein
MARAARWVAIVVTLALASAFAHGPERGLAAAPAAPVYLFDCGPLATDALIEPESWSASCQAGVRFTALRWGGWGQTVATAEGAVWECGSGHPCEFRLRGQVRLSDIRRCVGPGGARLVYTRARIDIDGQGTGSSDENLIRTSKPPGTQCEERAEDAPAPQPQIRVLGPVAPGRTVPVDVSGFPSDAHVRAQWGLEEDPPGNCCATALDPHPNEPGYPIGPTGVRVLDIYVPRRYLDCLTLACERAGAINLRTWSVGEPVYLKVSADHEDVDAVTEARIADPSETPHAKLSFAADDTAPPAGSFIRPLSVVSLLDGGGTATQAVQGSFDTWKVPLDPRTGLPLVSGHEPPRDQPPLQDIWDCTTAAGAGTRRPRP